MKRLALLLMLIFALPVYAEWSGRFELGSYSVLFDDDLYEDRTPLRGGFRLDYTPESGNWVVRSNIKLQTEFESEETARLRVRDLYVRYGQKNGQSPVEFTAGLFNPRGVTGTGDVAGADFRFNLNPSDESSNMFSAGLFGGGNAVTRESRTDIDRQGTQS